ncbi:MAG: TlpA disulfide reductase family protein [Smithella sp.]|nr:TlpA disulfide reductase family protein [Smithella sp.]
MKKKKIYLSVMMMTFLASVAICAADSRTPQVGDILPVIELSKPGDSAELKYLGLSGSGVFKVQQIKAEVLIIEIFSMYCPYCQAEAPSINELYKSIENNPALNNKIKIIGIGTGNTSFETDIFRKKYQVAFPLFPDGDFKLHKIIGEVRTPYFFVVKLKGGKAEVIYSKLGALGDNKSFLNQIVKSAGLK